MKLQLLIIHCTATPEGREITSDKIREWHLSPPPVGRGWKQVGYSDMVHLDGKLENLVTYNEDENVDSWEITNGASGKNSISRHIVYVGGIDKMSNPKDTRTEAQKDTMEVYVKNFLMAHPKCKVAGHYHFASKACPSFVVEEWLREIGVEKKNIHQ